LPDKNQANQVYQENLRSILIRLLVRSAHGVSSKK